MKYLSVVGTSHTGSSLWSKYLDRCVCVCFFENWRREGGTLSFVQNSPEHIRWIEPPIPSNYNILNIVGGWLKEWRTHPNFDHNAILYEKTPFHSIILAQRLESFFLELSIDPHFILLIRNPYAFVESELRSIKKGGELKPESCSHYIQIWQKFAQLQIENWHKLENSIIISYESLCADPLYIEQVVADFIPELIDLDFGQTNIVPSCLTRPGEEHHLRDLNAAQLLNLNKEQIGEISENLKREPHITEFFNYEVL